MRRHPLALVALTAVLPCVASAADTPRDRGLVDTHASRHARLHSVNLADVRWTDGFWADRFAMARDVSLPRLYELMADPEMGHALQNQEIAAGRREGEFQGEHWQDAWVYKWVESASYVYEQTRDPELRATMDRLIEVIGEMQEEDGYTASQTRARGWPRFKVPHHHELYTMGHLLTAACAHHRVTGQDNFLTIARGVADYVSRTFTSRDESLADFPFNPSIIMGSVDLYRATGEQKYLDLARFFIDWRGSRYGDGTRSSWGPVTGGSDQTQNWRPLKKESEVVGHAVFFTYLYAGATDAYLESGDEALMSALGRVWDDLTEHKMYVTGGVSPVHKGLSVRELRPGHFDFIEGDPVHEGVGAPYALPNDTAYNETCGQIGNVMWNWRMLLATGEVRFADLMERTIYNSVLSGVNLRGDKWTYTNPLRWHGLDDHLLYGHDEHERFEPGRTRICCPTNLLRTTLSWHNVLYSTDASGLWVHQYGGNVLDTTLEDGRRVRLRQETLYPWDGRVRLTVEAAEGGEPFALRLRVPGWARDATVAVGGEEARPVAAGQYAVLERVWTKGEVVDLDLPMAVRLLVADPRLESAANHVTVQRGPVIYTLESTDLPEGADFYGVRLPRDAEWAATFDPDLLGGVTVLETDARAYDSGYGTSGGLYRELPSGEPRTFRLRLIPYYAWNNRGTPRMTVWIPVSG